MTSKWSLTGSFRSSRLFFLLIFRPWITAKCCEAKVTGKQKKYKSLQKLRRDERGKKGKKQPISKWTLGGPGKNFFFLPLSIIINRFKISYEYNKTEAYFGKQMFYFNLFMYFYRRTELWTSLRYLLWEKCTFYANVCSSDRNCIYSTVQYSQTIIKNKKYCTF